MLREKEKRKEDNYRRLEEKIEKKGYDKEEEGERS